ncbi:MAG TPA: hypothetical protein VLU24_08445 [Mycobacterium sp.]|nr:hypothetical protein [Mycobacterium sp.]
MADELPADIVALTGRELPRLLGAPHGELTATALHAGMQIPIHIQIDRRALTAEGRWQYIFDASAAPASPGLGEEDLVLLATGEGGERVRTPPAGTTEIEVLDASGTTRWFYLSRGTPSALPPLVSYDAAADRIRGQDYALGFSRNGTPVIDALVLGEPDHGSNILDRSKARLDVELALGIGKVTRTEDDVRIRTIGVHRGPLRVIRECEVRGRMLLGLYSPPVRDNFVFYAHGFVLPTTMRLTPTARMLTKSVTLRISMDLVDAAGGLTFQSEPEIPGAVPVNGLGGVRGGTQPVGWYLLRHDTMGLLGWLEAPADIAGDVTLYYRDDRAHADPPEQSPGEVGDHGFLYRHSRRLPAGDIRLSSHTWVLHGEQLDQPAAQLRAVASRPTVRVH